MTTTNFQSIPALKGFFQCTETSGNALHCSCSNLTWDLTGSGHNLIFNTESGGISSTLVHTSPAVNFTEGSVCPLISTSLCYVWVSAGRLTGSSFFRTSVGDITEGLPEYLDIGCGMGMSDNLFHAVLGTHGTGNYIGITGGENLRGYAIANGPTDVFVVLKYDGVNNSLEYTAYKSDNGEVILNATLKDFTAVLPDLEFNPCFRFSGIELYGVQLWEFSAFPSDLLDGLAWQSRRWALGKSYRDIYPAWAGTSGGVGVSSF